VNGWLYLREGPVPQLAALKAWDIQRWNQIMSGTSTEQTDFIMHLVKHAFGEHFLEGDASWQSADLLPTFNALKATVRQCGFNETVCGTVMSNKRGNLKKGRAMKDLKAKAAAQQQPQE